MAATGTRIEVCDPHGRVRRHAVTGLRRALAAACLLALPIAACADGGPNRSGPDTNAAIRRALERVPASVLDEPDGDPAEGPFPVLWFSDVASAAHDEGLRRPAREAWKSVFHQMWVLQHRRGLTPLGPFEEIEGPMAGYYGVGLQEIDSVVRAGRTHDDVLVLAGSFDEAAVDHALARHEDEPQRERRDEATVWTWPGEELAVSLDTWNRDDPLDEVGQPLRVAVLDDTLARTRTTRRMREVLDGPSVLEDRGVGPVLEALLERGAYSGAVVTEPWDLEESLPFASREQREEAAADPTLAPFRTLAIAAVPRGDRAVILVVLLHANPDAARANADRLETVLRRGKDRYPPGVARPRQWGERFGAFAVHTDGALVVAELQPAEADDIAGWEGLVFTRTNLLAVER